MTRVDNPSFITRFVGRIWAGRTRVTATLQTLLTQVLIQGINVGTGVLTMRVLGVESNGELSGMIIPGNLANALTLGLPTSVTYNFKRHPDRRASLFGAAMLLAFLLGLLTAVIGFFVIPWWLSRPGTPADAAFSPAEIRCAQLLMLVAPITIMTLVVGAVLAVEGDFAMSNQTRYLAPALTLVLLCMFWATHRLNAINAAAAYVLPSIPVFLLRVTPLWRRLRPSLKGAVQSAREILRYGIRSYGTDLIGVFAVYVDRALVLAFLLPSDLSAYAAALSLSRVINMVQASVVTVLLPSAAARPPEEVVLLTGRAARVSFAVTGLAALGIAIVGPFLLRIYGPKFLSVLPLAVKTFRILLIEALLSGTTWILAQAFMAVGRPTIVTVLQTIGLSLSLPLMVVLIPRFGLIGAALSLLISTTVRLLLILAAYPRILKTPAPRLILTLADCALVWNRLVADPEVHG